MAYAALLAAPEGLAGLPNVVVKVPAGARGQRLARAHAAHVLLGSLSCTTTWTPGPPPAQFALSPRGLALPAVMLDLATAADVRAAGPHLADLAQRTPLTGGDLHVVAILHAVGASLEPLWPTLATLADRAADRVRFLLFTHLGMSAVPARLRSRCACLRLTEAAADPAGDVEVQDAAAAAAAREAAETIAAWAGPGRTLADLERMARRLAGVAPPRALLVHLVATLATPAAVEAAAAADVRHARGQAWAPEIRLLLAQLCAAQLTRPRTSESPTTSRPSGRRS